jgi:ribosomal protein S18 acetylase RimI-like enzyme
MVEITVTAVKELDLRKLAKFMYDARKNTVFDIESRTLEHLEESRKKVTSDDNIIFTAYENDAIVGILRIYTGFPEITFTSLWDPMITQEEGREEIALALISFCKRYVKERGFSRLEILLSPLTEKHSEIYKENKSWYEKAGFYKATEEVLMRVDLNKLELSANQPKLLEGLRYERIENVENGRIIEPFFRAFSDRGDRLFRDMTKAQQLVSFNYWLRRSQPFHRSSIVIMKDDNFVGLIVVRQDDETAVIGPVAVVPEYKRKGIMKAALHESLRRMQDDGIKFGKLEADAKNEPAINLYKKFGFEIVHEQEYFAWRVE